MSTERKLHRIASLFGWAKTARRGPKAMGKRYIRAKAHKTLARAMRRSKSLRP